MTKSILILFVAVAIPLVPLAAQSPTFAGFPYLLAVIDNTNPTCSSSNLPAASGYYNFSSKQGATATVVNTAQTIVTTCRSNGTNWIQVGSSSGLPALANNNIWVGNGSSVATATALSSVTVGTATNLANGALNSMPYQTGTGATNFFASCANGVVNTNGSSVPNCSTTTPSGLTIPSPKLTGNPSATLLRILGSSTGYDQITSSLSGSTSYMLTMPTHTANDTFCLQTAANCGGSGSVTWQLSGSTVVTGSLFNIVPGTGVLVPCSNVSGTFTCTPAADSSFIASQIQTAGATSCVTSADTNTAYLCALNPSINSAGYSQNMVVQAVFDLNSGTSPTLAINGLAPLPLERNVSGVLTAIGTGSAGSLVSGLPYTLIGYGSPVTAFVVTP